jgi:hypothetical protein
MFENGNSYDHHQGLGWYWILQADLANAKIVEKPPSVVVEIADHALEILKPIENWRRGESLAPGQKHMKLGNEDAAKDRIKQRLRVRLCQRSFLTL